MTRFIFKEEKEFQKWIDDHVNSDKYECYITEGNEVVLIPLRSTRPLKYAYIKLTSETIEAVRQKLTQKGVKIYKANVEWADDRPVGVKFVPE